MPELKITQVYENELIGYGGNQDWFEDEYLVLKLCLE